MFNRQSFGKANRAKLIKKSDHSKYISYIVLLIILLNVGIAIPLAVKLNIDVDEAYSLVTSSKDPIYATVRAVNVEIQAPFYFVLLSIWRSLDSSLFFARLFSICCIVISIMICVKISKRFFANTHPGWMVSIVALNPFVIWAAVTIRLYALLILISALLILFFYDGYFSEKSRNYSRYCFTITAVVGLYTQYYTGFLLVAFAVGLIWHKRWEVVRVYFLQMLLVGLSIIPILIVLPDQIKALPAVSRGSYDFLHNLDVTLTRFQDYIIPLEKLSLDRWGRWVFRVMFLTCCVVFLFKVVKNKLRFMNRGVPLICLIAAVMFGIYYISLVYYGRELLLSRHTTILFIPSILLVMMVFVEMNSRRLFKLFIFGTLFVYSLGIFGEYRTMAKSGDFVRIASHIMQCEKEKQPILIYPASASLPLKYHYAGVNSIICVPNPPSSEEWNIYDSVLKSEDQIVDALSSVSAEKEALWVVLYPTSQYMGIKYNKNILEEFIEEHYSVESENRFYKGTMVLFIRKKDNR